MAVSHREFRWYPRHSIAAAISLGVDMARMFPERPRAGAPTSERRVYDYLERTLDERFVVFHSLAWHGRANKADGEVDFLIAHPDLGMLVLEVKGGGIAYDPVRGQWTSQNKEGRVNEVNDPWNQALDARGAVRDQLWADPRWPHRKSTMGWAVVLTDTEVGPEGFGYRERPEVTFGKRDLARLGPRVVASLTYWAGIDGLVPPRLNGIDALIKIFGTAKQYRVSLSDILKEDEGRIIELTEQQFEVLDGLARHRRMAIAGCAGSGKTILAVQKAFKLAADGYRVLLVCFNAPLAGHWHDTLNLPPRVTVRHFHGLCGDLARSAGLKRPAGLEDRAYVDWLPDALLEAATVLDPQFDAIVVDEGQDFAREWLDTLELLLANGVADPFYVFFDDNQRLHGDRPLPAWLGEPYQLTRNVRNTNQIGRVVDGFYQGPAVRLSGVEGRPVDFVTYADGSSDVVVIAEVKRALERLRNAGADLSDVVVLGPRRAGAVWRQREFGQCRLYSADAPDGNVYYDTIYAFKGQDSGIVVLVELEQAADTNEPLDALLYVGASRAKALLVVVAPESIARQLQLHEVEPVQA